MDIPLAIYARLLCLPTDLVHLTSTLIYTSFSYLRTRTSNRWHMPLLNRFEIGPSRVPRFLIDSGHPWIKANRASLERIDARSALLVADSPLRSRIEPIPTDLFKSLCISNDRSRCLGTLGWQYAQMILKELLSCQAALDRCESLKVDIYRHGGGRGALWEPATPPQALMDLFVEVLSKMSNLETLVWIEPSDDIRIATSWREGFHHHDLELPTVKALSIGFNMEFLIPISPNLRSICTIDRDDWEWAPYLPDFRIARGRLLRSAGMATGWIEFTMKAHWDPELLETVFESMPQLQILRMKGRVGRDDRFAGNRTQKLRVSWISTIPSFLKYTNT